jgi:hypothetical protein
VDERPWYIDFFGHGDLDGGPLELDASFLVTLSGRAGKGIS